jgi:hypothetical protein
VAGPYKVSEGQLLNGALHRRRLRLGANYIGALYRGPRNRSRGHNLPNEEELRLGPGGVPAYFNPWVTQCSRRKGFQTSLEMTNNSIWHRATDSCTCASHGTEPLFNFFSRLERSSRVTLFCIASRRASELSRYFTRTWDRRGALLKKRWKPLLDNQFSIWNSQQPYWSFFGWRLSEILMWPYN